MRIYVELYGEKVAFDVPYVPLTENRLKSAMERMTAGRVKEYWVQRYVKENAKKLEFSKLIQSLHFDRPKQLNTAQKKNSYHRGE